jgi:DNA-binding transcriptional LysR family regulator
LRHLWYFVKVAELLHFGKAAKALHISQPPLSRQIQALERHLGTALFERNWHGVRLTDAGRVFLDESRRILDQVGRAVRLAQRAAEGEVGRLAVGYTQLFELTILPSMREQLARAYPGILTRYHELTSEEQIGFLRDGSLDAGFVLLPITEMRDLMIEPLFREPAIAVVSKSHPLARVRVTAAHKIRKWPVVRMLDGGSPLNPLEALLSSVRESHTVGLLPASLRELAVEGGVRCLTLEDRSEDFVVAAVYRRGSAALKHLLNAARTAAEQWQQYESAALSG